MKGLKYLESISRKEYIKKNYSLDNIKKALEILGSPHKSLKNVIHITGTNGKGSVAFYLVSFLRFLGYTTGLYISPHIFDVTERIQYNSKPINKRKLNSYIIKIEKILDKELFLALTYFELLTCVMFLYFADKNPDFVVLEVGLGGKLDATNVVEKTVISCITSISLDHTEVLGKTEMEILKDKSGIVKPNSVCVCGEIREELLEYLKEVCLQKNTKLVLVKNKIRNLEFDKNNWTTIFRYRINNKSYKFNISGCSLKQPYNVQIVLVILQQLQKLKLISYINYEKISNCLLKIKIPFRMHYVKYKKLNMILDGAHNPQAIENFVNTIKKLKLRDIVLCFSIMKEKDYNSILKLLSSVNDNLKKFILYKINHKRCANLKILYSIALKYFCKDKILVFNKPNRYLLSFLNKNYTDKLIFFVGTFYLSTLFNRKILRG
ncbi:MAG: Mur ligase family protein [Endomicrobia bacterium]|nr:Mur ligase family protein [Endomicrobiia bacterium]